MLEDKIYLAINSSINCKHLEVSGDGKHFDAIVVSDDFCNKNRVARHRYMHQVLGNLLAQEVHALSMKLYTQEEWKKHNG